jgi:hypothetical protein
VLRVELNGLRELRQGSEAALHVADCVGRHGWAKTSVDEAGSQVRNGSANDES